MNEPPGLRTSWCYKSVMFFQSLIKDEDLDMDKLKMQLSEAEKRDKKKRFSRSSQPLLNE